MPQDDSTESTDLIDVMRGALAAPWLRVLVVWLVSAAGTVPVLAIHQISLMAIKRWHIVYDPLEWRADYDDFWMVSLGAPVSFIGSIVEWRWYYGPAVIEWLVILLSFAAALIWLRAAIRVCAGRWLATSVCHLFGASSTMSTGWLGAFWWIGVGLTAVMVIAWYWWDGFRELRASEADYERDGI